MKSLFDNVSRKCNQMITKQYSTSFYWSVSLLDQSIRPDIFDIYGFVRLADEIVDSFRDFNKAELLADFRAQTFKSIEDGVSCNPVLNGFQNVVNQYQIDHQLIHHFLDSMEMDLEDQVYDEAKFKKYILGSAEVVGLMCLFVFVQGNQEQYEALKPHAMSLGAAFQKVNFLRDLKADYTTLGRTYFPNIDFKSFTVQEKIAIEKDIAADFADALIGIQKLPNNSKFAVLVAYMYYHALFRKIQALDATHILSSRVRIPNYRKFGLMVNSYCKLKLQMV